MYVSVCMCVCVSVCECMYNRVCEREKKRQTQIMTLVLHILHCPLSGPDLIYISLLIISCIIEYVTNKTLKLETCLRGPVGSKDFQEIGPLHLVHIKEGDEWKTAFNTPLGHFELHFWGLLIFIVTLSIIPSKWLPLLLPSHQPSPI